MKQLNHFSVALVALLGVTGETLLLPPKDYKQMALQNEIGESPGWSHWSASTSGSEKWPRYHQKMQPRAYSFPNLMTPISSNTIEESADSIGKNKFDFGESTYLSSNSKIVHLDSKQKRCFVDYQQNLKALLANSTRDSSSHKVRKYSLVQDGSERTSGFGRN